MPPSIYGKGDYSWLKRSSRPNTTTQGPPESYTSTSRKRAREEENGHVLGINSSSIAAAARSAKRGRDQVGAASGTHEVIDLTGDEPERPGPSTPKKKPRQSKGSPKSAKSQEERRLRVFRKRPPQTFQVKMERARTQRLAKRHTPPILLESNF